MKKNLKITYDKEADAMYIYLNDRKIKRTKEIANLVFIDVDLRNKPVGIEILNVSRRIGKEILSKAKPVYKKMISSIPIEILSSKPLKTVVV